MIRKERGKKRYRVSEIEDLFFYTLYNFRAYWVAGEIHNKVSRRIKQMCKINVYKYIVELHSEDLIHIFYRHFHDSDVRQKNISVNDVKKILDLINYCDSVEMSDLDHLKFKKRFPNGSYTFIVTIDNENKRLLGKTFWISA